VFWTGECPCPYSPPVVAAAALWKNAVVSAPVGAGAAAWRHGAVASGRSTTADDARRPRHVLLVLVEARVDESRRRTVDDTRRRHDATAAAVDAADVRTRRAQIVATSDRRRTNVARLRHTHARVVFTPAPNPSSWTTFRLNTVLTDVPSVL